MFVSKVFPVFFNISQYDGLVNGGLSVNLILTFVFDGRRMKVNRIKIN